MLSSLSSSPVSTMQCPRASTSGIRSFDFFRSVLDSICSNLRSGQGKARGRDEAWGVASCRGSVTGAMNRAARLPRTWVGLKVLCAELCQALNLTVGGGAMARKKAHG